MGVLDDIARLGERGKELRAEMLRHEEKTNAFYQQLTSIPERIKKGATTGDPLQDFALVNTSWKGCGDCVLTPKSEETPMTYVSGAIDNLKAKVAKFTPGDVHVLDYCITGHFGRAQCVAIIDNPSYEIAPEFKALRIRTRKNAIVVEKDLRHFRDIQWHEVVDGPAVFEGIPYHYGTGWEVVERKYADKPQALVQILAYFGRPVSEELKKKADAAQDAVALHILNSLDSQLKKNEGLWKEVQARMEKIEKLEKKVAQSKGVPIIHPMDTLDRDMAEDALDLARLKGTREHEYDRSMSCLQDCLQEAMELGLHAYPRIIEVPIRPGEKRVFDVAAYVTSLCRVLEINVKK